MAAALTLAEGAVDIEADEGALRGDVEVDVALGFGERLGGFGGDRFSALKCSVLPETPVTWMLPLMLSTSSLVALGNERSMVSRSSMAAENEDKIDKNKQRSCLYHSSFLQAPLARWRTASLTSAFSSLRSTGITEPSFASTSRSIRAIWTRVILRRDGVHNSLAHLGNARIFLKRVDSGEANVDVGIVADGEEEGVFYFRVGAIHLVAVSDAAEAGAGRLLLEQGQCNELAHAFHFSAELGEFGREPGCWGMLMRPAAAPRASKAQAAASCHQVDPAAAAWLQSSERLFAGLRRVAGPRTGRSDRLRAFR